MRHAYLGRVALLLAACGPAACGLGGCGGELTEIIVVVDTDIADVDTFRISAIGPDGATRMADADLRARAAPRRLVLHHRGGALGPVRLTVRGLAGTDERAAVERDVTFEPGQSLTLRVFLTACACPGGQTCANDGTCRGSVVEPCEFEGRMCPQTDAGVGDAGVDAGGDAGPDDAGPGDAGPGDAGTDAGPPCAYDGTVCGVSDRLLPGDEVTIAPCAAPPGPVTITVTGPSGALADAAGAYRLEESGSYDVEIVLDSAGCGPTRSFEVASAVAVPDMGVSRDALRDFDARVGTGFVVGRRGAYGVDETSWVDLRAPGVATGDVPPEDLRSVVVVEGQGILGPSGDQDAVFRVDPSADLRTAPHVRVGLPPGRRDVAQMGRAVDGTGPIALATEHILVLSDPTGAPSANERNPSYSAEDWVTLGVREHGGIGSVWGGRTDEVVNRRLSGAGDMLNDGAAVNSPGFLGAIGDAWVDDRVETRPNLWLCGSTAVARFSFRAGVDWADRTSLPSPDYRWDGACVDMGFDEPGRIWVVDGSAAPSLLESDATLRLTMGVAQGFPATAQLDFVATAWDATTREVWFLDASARTVYVMRADALP